MPRGVGYDRPKRIPDCHPEKKHAAFGMCKTCYSSWYQKKNPEKAEAYRDANKDRMREYRLQRKYGIGLDEWNGMFQSQAGRCAVCQRPLPLLVDHDHLTGRVRGLLCNDCNLALGFLNDSPERALSLAEYLRRGEVNGFYN